MSEQDFREIARNGLWRNNPGLVQLLGLCPLLGTSNSTVNALGLGLATMLVLACSNAAVSLVRGAVSEAIRLPAFVMIIAVLTTCIELLMQAWTYELYQVLGIFIPLITTNRINTPEVAEKVLAEGDADMVSMARPFLADPDFVNKAAAGHAERINTCIGCNQACLDHTFGGKLTSCLVNPRACHETELNYIPTTRPKKIAVVGAGPAGLAAATVAAERGHRVSLFDAAGEIGGQFNVAKRVPGKEEFHETLRYFRNKLESTGVELHLNRRVDVDDLVAGGYDEIVLATGIVPRTPAIPGIEHPKVISYLDAILERKPVGGKVAVIGAGGIGFDVSEFITHAGPSTSLEREAFWKEWGIDTRLEARGGIAGVKAEVHPAARQVFLLQRKKSKVGDGLGKTTGWIHRAGLKNKQVQMVNAVEYLGIDDAGLHIRVAEGEPQVLPVDTVIVCAGQDPLRELQDGLLAAGQSVHLIGGADVAAELDAKRAINQGSRLAAEL